VSSRRVTSQDVAERAGVSRTTVSLVLNDVEGVQISAETRERVIKVAQDLGYVPEAAAQALASGRSKFIGLVLTRQPHHIATDTFLTQIINPLVEMAHRRNMRLLLDIIEEVYHQETYLSLVRGRRIDGILLFGPRLHDEGLRALEKEGFPTVLMGNLPETAFYTVDIDNYAAARSAVAHLIQLGHKRIACITNGPVNYTSSLERLRGYRQALEDSGMTYNENLVRYGEFNHQSGYDQMSALLELKPRPQAVFVASDVVAFGAMAAIRDHKFVVPGDISLVGFDDIPSARFMNPPLSTVHLPSADLARKSFEVLYQLIRHQRPAKKRILLDTHLVVRQSCGAKQIAN
jgi:DNA-binding LacI/PurR family transcriptional regulator